MKWKKLWSQNGFSFINKSGNSNLKKLPIKFLEREILKKIVFKKNYTNFEKDKNENKDL